MSLFETLSSGHKNIGDKWQWKRIRIVLSGALSVEQKTEYFMKSYRAFQNVVNAGRN
jgi:hypothetical protein